MVRRVFTQMVGPPSPEAERLVAGVLDDYRKLIAALKLQRWDATKWTVTVNIALATVAVTLRDAKWIAAFMAVFVSVLGSVLVYHYNERATKVRKTIKLATDYLCDYFCDYRTALGINLGGEKSRNYDREELMVFGVAVWLSALPTLVLLVLPSTVATVP